MSDDNNDLFTDQPAIAADGTLTFTVAPNANGAATVTVHLHDNGGTVDGGENNSDDVTFTITVDAANDAPVATDDNATVAEDGVLSVDAPGVLANDSDVDRCRRPVGGARRPAGER